MENTNLRITDESGLIHATYVYRTVSESTQEALHKIH